MPITVEGGEETKIAMEQFYTDDYDQYTEGKTFILVCICSAAFQELFFTTMKIFFPTPTIEKAGVKLELTFTSPKFIY